MRALVVDDSEAMRGMLAMILRKFGFEVFDAEDAERGMTLLRAKYPVDLALVDWRMPGIDGIAFIRQVRASGLYKNLKILMTTAVNEVGNAGNARAAGADEFLLKPLTTSAVRDKLRALGFVPN